MLKILHDPKRPDDKLLTKVRDEIVNDLRKENIIKFGVDILIIVFIVIATSGLIVFSQIIH